MPSAARRPNILLIVLDDVGFADLGAYGSEIATPNIDSIAARGLRYTQAEKYKDLPLIESRATANHEFDDALDD